MQEPWDAVIVGSGPNGLAAALTLAEAGRSVLILEGADTFGGGLRSDRIGGDLVRDRCAAILPFAVGSPFFRGLDLEALGVTWAFPEVQYSQPLDDGRAGAAFADIDRTADHLGDDGARWRRTVGPHADRWWDLAGAALGPVVRVPSAPLVLARYGVPGLVSAQRLAGRFATEEAKGLIAGCAAHSVLPFSAPLTAAVATLFAASAHAMGWPAVAGGSQVLADALVARLHRLGVETRTDASVGSLDDLPPHRAVLFDLAPRQVLEICGGELGARSSKHFERFRHGPGICKVDHVLDGPVPWADAFSAQAGTVHVGGTFDQCAAAEAAVAAGGHPDQPFVLVAQQDVADPSRVAADGRRALWAYTHVPAGSDRDCAPAIEAQIERFAPGFRDRILERHVTTADQLEDYNPTYIGGDITGGSFAGLQTFRRPRWVRPYGTDNPTVFMCGAATPPGGGVHGMAGHHAAKLALKTALG